MSGTTEHSDNYTPELRDRIEQLKSLPWREIEQAAESVDLHEKPDDETWKAQADKIAVEEFRRANKPIYAEHVEQAAAATHAAAQTISMQLEEQDAQTSAELPTKTSRLDAQVERVARMKANGLPVCDVCGEQWQSGFGGRAICPVDASDCPRLQEDD